MFKRVFLIVLDSVGIGENSTSHLFDDLGANTLLHIEEKAGLMDLKNLDYLGLKSLINLKSLTNFSPNGVVMKLDEASMGKDTLTGHLEMMCLKTTEPFKTFTSFPKDLLDLIYEKTGFEFIGNKVASGTEILVELGNEHIATKKPILYTSSDSVLQVAAHIDVLPLTKLYELCKTIREITLDKRWKVGRIIARPFTGTYPNFIRTKDRHDYALSPVSTTALDLLKENNYDVISVGKIADIFNNSGITRCIKSTDNEDGISKLLSVMNEEFMGLCFVNLVDFDMLYGHRRDPYGYKTALESFDVRLKEILASLQDTDLLMITADHGNDPTYKGTDHTREYVLLICYHNNIKGKLLDIRNSFSDIGKTILDNFKIKNDLFGISLLKDLIS